MSLDGGQKVATDGALSLFISDRSLFILAPVLFQPHYYIAQWMTFARPHTAALPLIPGRTLVWLMAFARTVMLAVFDRRLSCCLSVWISARTQGPVVVVGAEESIHCLGTIYIVGLFRLLHVNLITPPQTETAFTTFACPPHRTEHHRKQGDRHAPPRSFTHQYGAITRNPRTVKWESWCMSTSCLAVVETPYCCCYLSEPLTACTYASQRCVGSALCTRVHDCIPPFFSLPLSSLYGSRRRSDRRQDRQESPLAVSIDCWTDYSELDVASLVT